MRLKSLTLAALFSVFAASTSFAASPSAAESVAQVNRAVISSQMLEPVVQLNRNCSASIIKSALNDDNVVETLVLTAKHCIKDRSRFQEVYIPTFDKDNRIVREEIYRATFVMHDPSSDITILKIMDDITIFPTVNVAPADVKLYEGEDIWVVGWSRGQIRAMTTGNFGNREYIDFPGTKTQTEFFRASAQIAPGNSGGALFHRTVQGDYQLIGVTSAYNTGSDFIAYFVPINEIRRLIRNRLND